MVTVGNTHTCADLQAEITADTDPTGQQQKAPHVQRAPRRSTDLEGRRLQIRKFVWTLFLHAKGKTPATSSDLVLAYCLLLCVFNFAYQNARQNPTLINPE
jgi:hypothetical protein